MLKTELNYFFSCQVMHVMHVSMLKITLEKAQENDFQLVQLFWIFQILYFQTNYVMQYLEITIMI